MTNQNIHKHPAFLVGYPPITPVTDAAPVGDYDTGYHPPLVRKPIPATGAWTPATIRANANSRHRPMNLELGRKLPSVTLAYETWGELNDDGTNAVLLCHALTEIRMPPKDGTDGWWNDIVGPGKAIDTDRWFVVCPNVLGGCRDRRARRRQLPMGSRGAHAGPRSQFAICARQKSGWQIFWGSQPGRSSRALRLAETASWNGLRRIRR